MRTFRALSVMVWAAVLLLASPGCLPPNTLHSLTVVVEPASAGTVVITPAQSLYQTGEEIAIEAVANPGWRFLNWQATGFNTTQPATTITLRDDATITAVFERGGAAGDLVQDGGFEQGPINTFWTDTSINFDTIICDVDGCGTVDGLGPNSGIYWVYFGGTPENQVETATVTQEIAVPNVATASLEFFLAIPSGESAFTFSVSVGPTQLLALNQNDAAGFSDYTRVSLDVSRFATGEPTTLQFSYTDTGVAGQGSAVFVDDVSIVAGSAHNPNEGEEEGEGDTIAVTNPILPDGTVGQLYSENLEATGGLPPYLWTEQAIAPSQMPPGLMLSSGGTVFGTPEVFGVYTFGVVVEDSAGATRNQLASVEIQPGAGTTSVEILSGPELPVGEVDADYNQLLGATGGTPPYVWSAPVGAVPPGLDLTSGGRLLGVPSAEGRYVFEVTAEDAESLADTTLLALDVNAAGETAAVEITTASPLPDGRVSDPYSFSMQAENGIEPYVWSVPPGNPLPDGMLLTSGGSLTGVPEESGLFTITVRATDGLDESDTESFALEILTADETPAEVALTSASPLPDGQVQQPYAFVFEASGGEAPYRFSLVDGLTALPINVSLTSGGTLSGTPLRDGLFTFEVRATDANGASGTAIYQWSVLPELSGSDIVPVTGSDLLSAQVGVSYNLTLEATGGVAPYNWSLESGPLSLPVGMLLTSGGTLTGTPINSGEFVFQTRITDAENSQALASFTLTVNPAAR